MPLVFAVILRVRLQVGNGGGVSARICVGFGDGIGETVLTSLLLSNTAAAASSHVGIGGSCLASDGHGVTASAGVSGVVGIDVSRLSSLLLLLKTILAASSHVGIGGSDFVGSGWAVMVVGGGF